MGKSFDGEHDDAYWQSLVTDVEKVIIDNCDLPRGVTDFKGFTFSSLCQYATVKLLEEVLFELRSPKNHR